MAAPPVGPCDVPREVTTFRLPGMDCSSEESLVRMALGEVQGVEHLRFDLANHLLWVTHRGKVHGWLPRLRALNLGATMVGPPVPAAPERAPDGGRDDDRDESSTLKTLLAINAAMFAVELGTGLAAQSAGLIADSLDMFADAAVYGVALFAVGSGARLKLRAAHLAGWLQVILALGALFEVVRRLLHGSEPQSILMWTIGLIALAANVACLMLVAPRRRAGSHMKASYIFSANDVLANVGVIVAGLLVAWTGSRLPDLVVGSVIGIVVFHGGVRILRLR